MHLHTFTLKNFRRLQNVSVELGRDISIFVGANNSGKTSAAQAVEAFVRGSKERFSLYDFNSLCWRTLDQLGVAPEASTDLSLLPVMSLDLWLEVDDRDLHRVIDLLPSIHWRGKHVGIRIAFAPAKPEELMANYRAAHDKAEQHLTRLAETAGAYAPWPKSLSDFLQRELRAEYEFQYFVLDHAQFGPELVEPTGYVPLPLAREGNNGATIVKSLIEVNCIDAHRKVGDGEQNTGAGRSEDLSRLLSRFYQRNLAQRDDDHTTLKALFDSEVGLNEHLKVVFAATMSKLEKLGYPGMNNPIIEIRSALNPAAVMSQDAKVHYRLGDGDAAVALPDSYNGLGYKNLIYMVVELLDRQERWRTAGDMRPPLHVVFIEEPEAHLHAQMQQVFIRNILELMRLQEEGEVDFETQLIVTTHSPHILYEKGFKPIRYFRRHVTNDNTQSCSVVNLSRFYAQAPRKERDFLERYLKLTHCDLFFADAAILVEGNVERLLLPAMIAKSAKTLRSASLSILEVGGAFAHRFRMLIEHLGLKTLIITDLDSVAQSTGDEESEDDEEIAALDAAAEEGAPAPPKRRYRTCEASTAGAQTSNQTLINWLPKLKTIAELIVATEVDRTQSSNESSFAEVRITYQTPQPVAFGGVTVSIAGRTLEEAFGLENADWCQAAARQHLKLRLRAPPATPADLATGLHKRVSSKSFDKTGFALGILTEDDTWCVPAYIRDGLQWLNSVVALEKEIEAALEMPDPAEAIVAELAEQAVE